MHFYCPIVACHFLIYATSPILTLASFLRRLSRRAGRKRLAARRRFQEGLRCLVDFEVLESLAKRALEVLVAAGR